MFESLDAEPRAQRRWLLRPWPLAMLIVLGVLLVGVIYLAATASKDGDEAAANGHGAASSTRQPAHVAPVVTPTSSAAMSSIAVSAPQVDAQLPVAAMTDPIGAAVPSVCGLAPGDQQVPVSPPPAVWKLVGPVAVPTSAAAGPGVVDERGVGDCFAHSPTGALFAAVGTLAALNVLPDLVSKVDVMGRRVAPLGDYYPDMLAQASAADAAAPTRMPSEPGATAKVSVLGFTFTDYTASRAVIEIALTVGDPVRPASYSQVLLPLVMVWYDGDWRLVYTDSMTRPQPVVSADQYIGWAP